jgi:NAD(P)-dependent dehydrogenase (short-subunit alcohol dehydrogenase family)
VCHQVSRQKCRRAAAPSLLLLLTAPPQSKAEDRKALIDFTLATYGKIDVVVLNAAVQPGAANGPTLSVPDEMFDKIFDVNVKSYWQVWCWCV